MLSGIVAVGLTLILALMSFFVLLTDDECDFFNVTKKWLRPVLAVIVVCSMVSIFTPSKSDLYAIYGIGGTIDYLKDNPEAQKLPDNLIKAANAFLEKNISDTTATDNNEEKRQPNGRE